MYIGITITVSESSALSMNVLWSFDMCDPNGTLCRKANSLFVWLFELVPAVLIVSLIAIFTSP